MSAVTVAQALEMEPLRGAAPAVLAGSPGLATPVRWVHTTELVDIAALLRGGDLVLSTGIALPEDPAGLTSFAESLHASDAAGLVIELGRRWTQVPDTLVAACDRLRLPLVALGREVRFAAVAQAVGERIVDDQLDELRSAQRVHDVFTQLGINEAGPEQILEATARLAGSTVVLEDDRHAVVDYRPGPDGAASFVRDWTERSRRVQLDGRTTWDAAQGWLVTRIGRAERGWGRLVLQCPQAPPQRAVAVVERAAAALALHRLHDRGRDGLVRRTHTELVLGLLTDPTSPELLERCEVAGLPVAKRQFVGLTLRPAQVGDEVRPAPEDLLAAVVHSAHEARTAALVAIVDRDVRVLLSLTPTADADRAADDLAQRVQRRQRAVVGAGRVAHRVGDIDRTLHESRHVVESVPAGHAPGAVLRLSDVHIRGLLAMLVDDDRVQMFVRRELGALREHDLREGSGLVDVVRALVQHPGSKADAAASLHMSRATFYDRLARVQRVLAADLDDPDVRVSLHVALLVEEVGGAQR